MDDVIVQCILNDIVWNVRRQPFWLIVDRAVHLRHSSLHQFDFDCFAAMELFQSLRRFYSLMGIYPPQPNHSNPFNYKILFFFWYIVLVSTSTLSYFLFKANSLQDYGKAQTDSIEQPRVLYWFVFIQGFVSTDWLPFSLIWRILQLLFGVDQTSSFCWVNLNDSPNKVYWNIEKFVCKIRKIIFILKKNYLQDRKTTLFQRQCTQNWVRKLNAHRKYCTFWRK